MAVVTEYNDRVGQFKNRIWPVKQENKEFRRSIMHKVYTKLHRILVKGLLPPSTRRRRYYDLGLYGVGILINEGSRSFFLAVKKYYNLNHGIEQKFHNLHTFKAQSGKPFSIDQSEFLPLNNKKIAVHVHVFYLEIFDEIIGYLNNIPINYTLFISVVSRGDKEIILEKITQLPHVEHADVRVVKNQGRNIAPFLVEFGPVFRNYNYICHIHTKKSMFSGVEQTDWRRYSFDRLLGSPDMVKAILTAFEKDPSVGIIYPEIFPFLPYWSCTWLSNKSIAPEILNRLNIRFDPDEYLDYPVGSMFWIRKESLEPLLDLKFNVSDFPEERGQTDGTLHHALERCFVLAGQSNGFRHLVVQNPSKPVFSYRSTRNLDQYLDVSFEKRFLQKLAGSDIVSFDIFDTLLIRPFATPHMVLSYLEGIIEKEFGIPRYKELRIKAESIARLQKKNRGDVKITEIYSVFSELAKIDTTTANRLLNLEVNTEKKLLIPRNEIIKSARHAKDQGKRIILVSDTYLERENIEDILFSKGIDFFDEIYLSSETGKRKDRGDLWEYVIDCEGITPQNFMHAGDNEHSDIQKIIDKGFRNCIHIMRPTALFRQSRLGAQLWEILKPYAGWRENLLYGKIANRLCSNLNEKQYFNSGQLFEDPHVAGYIVFGPIIFNFMNWLIKTSGEDDCQQLWFIAREGYLLNAVFEMIAANPHLPDLKENLPGNCYFLCSRRTAVFALLETERDIPRLIDGYFKGSLRELFIKRLSISSITHIEDRLGSETLNQQIILPKDFNRIFRYFERVMNILAPDAQTEREFLLEYCNTHGFDGSKRISVVDIGYSGTIQSALAELLNYSIEGYYFVTENNPLKISHSGSMRKAYFDENVPPYNKQQPIHRYSHLLEAVLNAPTGQVIRFDKNISNGIFPVFKEHGSSQKEFYRISQIHEGILKFIAEMIEEFGPNALAIEFPKDLVQTCYQLVIDGDIDIGSLKPILSVEDDYCGNEEILPLDFYTKQQSN